MSEKSINYMARDFNSIRNELVSLSKQYYPDLADSFNDASVGSWLLDLVSAVGDDLSYYIDRCYNEQNINTATLKSSVLNAARINNVKIPGPKAATCEVAISIVLPINKSQISLPEWRYAPKIPQGAVITNGSVEFETLEDVDFAEQFNRDAVSNRRWTPNRDSNGAVTSYTVTKTVLACAGRSRIYKKVITPNDLKPFMEFVLPFQNIMQVEGVIFKETSNLAITPDMFEFYINAEKFRLIDETINTYKFFEVDALTDQYVFGSEVRTPGEIKLFEDPHAYVEYNTDYVKYVKTPNDKNDDNGEGEVVLEGMSPFIRYYKGAWLPIMQKYITEYTDNGYLKLIFGSGTNRTDLEELNVGESTSFAQAQLSRMANNDLTGILPKAGWTMYVLYRDGGGTMTNIAPNALNRISGESWRFKCDASDNSIKNKIIQSVRVTNTSIGLGGADSPSVNEIKYITKYNNSAQGRCVTLKDYELRVRMMPAKYGAPYRCKAIEENNKVLIYMLGLDAYGQLTDKLHDQMINNVGEYLSHFKNLGDYVELRSGNIYNIQVEASIYVEKTYNKQNVVKNVIQTIDDYFRVDEHSMGENMFIGDLEKQISAIDGVANLINLKVFSKWGGEYGDKAIVPLMTDTYDEREDGYKIAQINLDAMNKILSSDAQGMYELKNKNDDIKIRVSTI